MLDESSIHRDKVGSDNSDFDDSFTVVEVIVKWVLVRIQAPCPLLAHQSITKLALRQQLGKVTQIQIRYSTDQVAATAYQERTAAGNY